jgi:hypothetical protein
MPGTDLSREATCLTRTCLQWTAQGELSDEDKQLVLQKLERVDPPLATSVQQ